MPAPRRIGQRAVEQIVEAQEFGAVFLGAAALAQPLLLGQLPLQLVQHARIGMRGQDPRQIALYRLADEARILDRAQRDLAHEGAALRADLDQPLFGQLDEGLAHRLTADAEA